jgi:Tol biopolymer transport system component
MFRETSASLLILSALAIPAGFAADTLELVSRVDPHQVSATAAGGNPESGGGVRLGPSLSADGRWAVFVSPATHLVAGQQDVNGGESDDIAEGGDVFLEDLATGAVTLVSHRLGAPATTGNLGSLQAALSADGRWVAFVTAATDVAPGQRGTRIFDDYDLVLFDRVSGSATLAAIDLRFREGYYSDLSFSADGRYLAFTGRGFPLPGQQGDAEVNAFLYDRVAGSLSLLSHAPGSPATGVGGAAAGLSADGRFAVVLSFEALLPGQTAGTQNAFLYDRAAGSLALIGPASRALLSADGGYVLLVQPSGPLSLYSRETGAMVQVTATAYPSLPLSLSADGRYTAFLLLGPADENGVRPGALEIYDRVSRTATPVSRAPGAAQPAPYPESLTLSADGRYLVFASADRQQIPGQVDPDRPDFENLDVFLFDRAAGKTLLVSHTPASAATAGNGASSAPAISSGGGRVVFTSRATDLASGVADLNQAPDLYAYDVARQGIDVATRHAPDLPSLSPGSGGHARALSADGRWVAFETDSANVVDGQVDANGKTDVFLYDATAKTVILVSHVPGSPLTAPAGPSSAPALSADGRYVAFTSSARNLVPGANPAGQPCVFLYDRATGAVTFVAPGEAPRISPDGRWIAFTSFAPGVVPGQQPSASDEGPFNNVFLWDRTTGTTVLVSHAAAGPLTSAAGDSDLPALSADGRYVAFHSRAGDLVAGQEDAGNNLFLFDRTTGANLLVSHAQGSATAPGGADSEPALSADGRFLLFSSRAQGLDPAGAASFGDGIIYLYDSTLGTYQQIGTHDVYPQRISLSADGRFAAFLSDRPLIPGLSVGSSIQVYLYDRAARSLTLASRRSQDGGASNGYADAPVLSADGRSLGFLSDGSDLVAGRLPAPGSGSGAPAAYLYDRATGKIRLLSRWQGSAVTPAGGGNLFLSADGQRAAFDSADDLVYGDFNRRTDAYLFSLDPPPPSGPVTLPPCNLFSGALRSNARKVLTVAGACGVPAAAKQVVLKVTVSQGTGNGNVQVYPGNVTNPSSGILRFNKGVSRSAGFTVPLGNGAVAVLPFVAGNGTVRVAVEVDGYVP